MEQQIIGKIVAATGEVFQQTNGQTIQLTVGSPVYKGAALVTGKGAHAEVLFVDDSMLSQSENTNISLDEYIFAQSDTPNAILLNLVEGTMRVITGKIAEENPENFEVKSPLAILGIRGTDFTFSHTPTEGSRVILNQISQNHVLIVRDQDGTIRYLNIPGSYVTIEEGLPISPIQFYTPEQMQQLLQLTPFTTLPNNGISSDDNNLPGGGEVKQGPEILAEEIEGDQQHETGKTDILSEDVAAIQQALVAGDFSILETMDPTGAGFEYSGDLPGQLFVYNMDGSFDNGTPGTNPFSQSQPGSHLYEPAGVNLPGTIFSAGQTPDLYSPVKGSYPGRTPLPQTSEEQPFQATPLDVQPFLTPTDGPPLLTPPVDGQSPPGTTTPTSSVIPPNQIYPTLPPGLTLHGTSGDDILMGGEGNDILMGYGGVDQMYGNGGNDQFVIWGTFGSSVYSGQDIAGNDLAVGSSFSHLPDLIIDGGTGYDTLISYGTADFSGVTLNSIEAIEIHSDVTFTPGQFAGITALTGIDLEYHTVTFSTGGQGPATVDLSNVDIINIDQIIIQGGVTVQVDTADLAGMNLSGTKSAITGGGTLIPVGTNISDFIDTYGDDIDNNITLGQAPTAIQINSSQVIEDALIGTVVGTLNAVDSDVGDSHSFVLAPNDFFSLNSNNEIVTDSLFTGPGSYQLDITATDLSGQSVSQTISIDVLDLNEAPTSISLDNQMVTENDAGAIVGILSTMDPNTADTHTYTVNDPRFEVIGDQLKLTDADSLDFETEPEVNVQVTATDSGIPNLSTTQSFTLTVEDVNEQVFRDLGQEFQVNTYTEGDQRYSSVTSLAGGGFVVTWNSEDQDGDYDGIFGQVFDADGNPDGNEFQVNTYIYEDQEDSSVTGLTDGGFVVTWTSYEQGGSEGIYGQVFDANGIPDPVGEFLVNSNTANSQRYSSVTSLAGGGFTVTWQSNDGSYDGIYGQVFNASGNHVGNEFQINTHTDDTQNTSSVTGLTDGGFVVTWTSGYQDGGYDGIFGQVFDGNGTPEGNEFQVNTHITYDQDESAVTSLADGGFVVTWSSSQQDGGGDGIYGQVFDANGNPDGSEFQINTYTTGNQRNSAVTSLADGGFVVTWVSQGQDGSYNGVYGQVFDAGGNPDPAGEFQVNSYTDLYQEYPSVTGLTDGGFVVTWTSDDQDGSDSGIYAQLFTTGEEVTASGPGIFYGNIGNDIIWGDSQDQTLYGRSGNDILKGGAGADALYGEGGDDTFVVWGTFDNNIYVDDPGTLNIDESLDETGDSLLEGNPNPADNHLVAGEIIDGGDGVDTLVTYGDVDLTTTDMQNMEILEIKDNSTVTVNESQITSLTITGQGSLKPVTSLSLPAFMTTYGVNIGQNITVGNAATAITILDSQQYPILSIEENSTGLIGYLSAVDQDNGDSHTFTLGNGTSYGFRIENDNELWLDRALDYESSDTVSIDIQATDLGHGVYDGSLSFSVNDVYEPSFRQLGQEFQVNTFTTNAQLQPAITGLTDGGFVVTWNSDGSYEGIYGQVFDADGNPEGNEFKVNTWNGSDQVGPAVTGLADGGFVVTWATNGHDGSSAGVYGQVFGASGNPVAGEFQVNTHTTSAQEYSTITSLAGGGFVVSWQSYDQDGSESGIYGQIFDPDGTPNPAGEFQINSTTTDYQEYPAITSLTDGGFVVSWQSYLQDGDSYGIYGQVFDGNGNPDPAGEFQVNTHTVEGQSEPAVTGLTDGRFVVTWDSFGQDGSYWGVYGQIFEAYGNPNATDEFQVNTYTSYNQKLSKVTSLVDGGFVVTWESLGQDGSSSGIYGQVFDAYGNPESGEFLVNTYTYNSQIAPSVTSLADGDFVIAWSSYLQDGDNWGIYAQMYTTGEEITASGPGTFYGNIGNDIIWGDSQNQTLYAGDGNDILKGGGSADTMYGEGGDDTFVVWGTFGNNIYMDDPATVSMDESIDLAGDDLLEGNPNPADNHIVAGEIIDGGDGEDTLATYGDVDLSTIDLQNLEILEIKNHSTVTVDESQLSGLTITGQGSLNTLTNLSLPDFMTSYGANIGQNVTVGNAATAILILDSQQNPILSIDENSTGLIGYLAAVDQDSGDSHTFTLTDGTGQGFRIENNNELWLDTALDYDTANNVSIDIQAADLGHGVYDGSLAFAVNEEYEPSFRQMGQEFLINTTTDYNQKDSAVASLADGGYVVTWTSAVNGVDLGVFGQIFDAYGNPDPAGEFQINTYSLGSQRIPSVTGLSDGGFVVTWQSDGQDGDSTGVYGQVFDASGSSAGNEFQVNTYTTSYQEAHSVTDLQNGGFVVTWTSDGQDGSASGVYGQVFDASGNQTGNEFLVNTYTDGHQSTPSVTGLTNGGFAITWNSNSQDGNSGGIYGQVFDANGNQTGNEFLVNTYTDSDQRDTAVTNLADGGFVVTWTSMNQDYGSGGIYGQVFDASGNPEGNEFRANTYTPGTQAYSAVSNLEDGGFVITWESYGQDGSIYGIYGKAFDASGNPNPDGEFLVNTYTAYYQRYPDITGLEDGGFVITWESYPQDGSSYGIYGQMYTIGEEITATGPGTFYGNIGNDIIWGDNQDQSIFGGDGNDILKGGAGADAIYGEGGDDTFVVWGTFDNDIYVDDPGTLNIDESLDPTGDSLLAGNPNPADNHLAAGEIIDGGDGVDTLVTYGDVDLTTTDVQNMETLEIKDHSTVTINESQLSGLTVTGQGSLKPLTSLSLPAFMTSYGTNIGQSITVGNAATAILILDDQQNQILSIDENSCGLIGYLSAQDQDSGDSHTFTITNGAGQDFRIENGNELWLDTALNYESLNTVSIDLQATDLGHAVYNDSLSFSVNDVNEQAVRTLGQEFQINTYTTNWQLGSDITSLADGGFVVTWHSYEQDGSDDGIYGQIFDIDGDPDPAGEFQVNTYTANNQNLSSVTSLTNGGFVVTWDSDGQDGDGKAIYGQIFDADGNPDPAGEFQVNTYTANDQKLSSVTSLTDGGFVVTWESLDQDGSDWGIYGQIFNAYGTPDSTGEFQVNTYTTSWQYSTAVTGLADGGFVVTWDSWEQDGSTAGIYGQVFDTEGNPDPAGEFQVNTYTDARQTGSAVTSMADGGFVVTWASRYQDDNSSYGVYGQIFDADGNPDPAGEFQINPPSTYDQFDPSLIGLENGGFIVTWTSDDQDGSDYGIYGQIFDGDGNPDPAGEFQINTYTDDTQYISAVTVLEDGNFVVTWSSYGQDVSYGYGIYGQMYTIVEVIAASGPGTFYGNIGNDIILGDSQDQSIYGGSGNDILKGGGGVDAMYGEDGDDTFVVWGAFAASYYLDAPATVHLDESIDPAGDDLLAGNPDPADNHLQAGEIIDGGDGNDTLITYGTLDLSQATITNIETIITHSNVTYGIGQLEEAGINTIIGEGEEAHILNFTGVGTVDLREVTVENIDEINIDSGVDLILSQEQEAELNVNVVEEAADETTDDIPTARGTDPVATQPLFGDSIPETDNDTTEDAPLTAEEPEEEAATADSPVTDEETAPEAPPEQLFGDSPEESEEEKGTETEEDQPLFGDNESDSGSDTPDGPETEEPLLADSGDDESMDLPANDPPADLPEDVESIDDVDIPGLDQADDLSAAA